MVDHANSGPEKKIEVMPKQRKKSSPIKELYRHEIYH